ncbi:MAG: peptidoglycan-associated lipoprotein Pal [Pseudomonadota bacterium]|nr:peptidoglycan-associated lipoprotein Pal [Pseudomonadota bacterium]
MKRMITIACLLAGAALLAGCPKKATTIQPATAGTQVGGSASTAPGGGASTNGSPLGGDAGANGTRGLGGDGTGASGRQVIYFDFDKSEIKPEFADIVRSNAQNLTAHPGLKLKLEGNTDERGTREYNIGLGERRAQAVRRALMLQGVSETQLTTVSFGAERPAAEGDDEAAWAQNRRVELVYLP